MRVLPAMKAGMPATAAVAAVAGALLALATAAGAQTTDPPDDPPGDAVVEPARLSVEVQGLHRGRRPVLRRTVAVGRLEPFVPGQAVRVRFSLGGEVVKAAWVSVRPGPGGAYGVFRLRSPQLSEPGRYRVWVEKPATAEQAAARTASRPFALRFPALRQGAYGRAAALLNRLLRKRGYHAPEGKRFTAGTADAVLAFRKVNRMAWTRRATPQIFERLARGKRAFKLRYPGGGRHVEVDLSAQVMVLASKGKPRHTFHISSGTASTPSDRGRFRFYWRQPGYNSLGMYYSVYYNGGEAVHGFRSVPTYPASRGCIRTPIPSARFIYGWVQLGMSIYVYE